MPDKIELICTFASLPKTERGKALVLGGDPKNGKSLLYCNSNNVYIRDINDPAKCKVYADHTAYTTVAKQAPSASYIASGDITGKVRVWDPENDEYIGPEYHVLGGAIKDIAWDSESKRLAICGEGRELYAKCITRDSGNTIGDLGGQTKAINAVAYKPNRPFRVVTVSEDFTTQFYEGPPFKYKKTNREHGNFVNCVRYHPNGDVFVTGGSDGKAIIYDGKTSELIGALGGEKAHKGGIYALDFSPNGEEVLTVSGDKTAKIWNLASKELVVEFVMGSEITDMQLGCLWQGDNIITVSLSGNLNYLDRNNPSSPKILKGHNKPIMAMAVTPDKQTVYTGAGDGQINYWDVNTGLCDIIRGKGHHNQVTDMTIAGEWLISIGIDDTVRFTEISKNEYDSNSIKLPSQPNAVAALPNGIAVITCINHIVVVHKDKELDTVFQQEVKFEPRCVDIHPGQHRVAFGGSKEIHLFELDGTVLKGIKKIDMSDDITALRFSPDGAYLAASTGSKRFTALFSLVEDVDLKEVYKTTKQTGKIFCVSWSPDSNHFATGSLDGSMAVWCLDPKYDKSLSSYEKFAHRKACVRNVAWLSNNKLITSSDDCCIKQWSVKC